MIDGNLHMVVPLALKKLTTEEWDFYEKFIPGFREYALRFRDAPTEFFDKAYQVLVKSMLLVHKLKEL